MWVKFLESFFLKLKFKLGLNFPEKNLILKTEIIPLE